MKKQIKYLVNLLMVSTRVLEPCSVMGTDSTGTGAMARLAATLCATLLLVSAGPSAAGSPTSATGFIADLAETSMRSFSESDLSKYERTEKFGKFLQKNVAVHGIARFVMGQYWDRATQEQQKEFVYLLTNTVAHTWSNRFSEILSSGLKITGEVPVDSSRSDETDMIVRTSYRISVANLPISWRVANRGKIYKITDVHVGGISMVTSYRSEIMSALRSNGGTVDGLLQRMRLNLAKH